ncbi:Cof-type HAD-IIB family hydrolase [Youxingia wuxianensis]|uniref:HAD family phosphatase n=1 Tax=Youxingia wuxianensis TaxID=2763678 RepID=A0A926EPQ3_9FIRM|nr:Cof-type HAD-IIB family hydrolase [Youxingia wuxianensis]MBC8586511.1 HAD family phosphatase [Youxingia wuxianensis]
MGYKVLALDIDGTLYNDKKEITPRVKKAIQAAQERGTIIVLSSGRPKPGMVKAVQELDLENTGGYVLTCNGGQVSHCKTGETVFEKAISSDCIKEIYNFAKLYGLPLMTHEGNCVVTEYDLDPYIRFEAAVNGIPVRKIDNFKEYIKFPVIKCIATGDGDLLGKLEPIAQAQLGDRLSIFRSESFFLEFMAGEVTKAYGLKKLLEHLGLSVSQLVACGDSFNDISMISYAGLGVAMANANGQVQAAADYVTLSNEEDGVAHVIEKFFLK